MISPGVKALVQRLLADDGFRQTFLRSPGLVLSSHTFSPEERRALLTFHSRLATAGGPSHVAAIRIAMPWP